MKKIAVSNIILFFMSIYGSLEAAQTLRGVNLLRFEPTLTWTNWDAQLASSASNIKITDFTIVDETNLDDSAEITIETWTNETSGAGNFVVFSHGNGDEAFSLDPGVRAEVYSTEAARNTRYDALIASGIDVVKSRNEAETQFAIYVLAENMPGVLGTGGLADSPVVLGIYCNSASTYDRWAWESWQAAVLGYNSEQVASTAIDEATAAMKALGCYRTLSWVPFTYKETASQAAGAAGDLSHYGAGTDNFTLNFNRGCNQPTPRFLEKGIYNGVMYWTVIPNSDVVEYQIRGYRDNSEHLWSAGSERKVAQSGHRNSRSIGSDLATVDRGSGKDGHRPAGFSDGPTAERSSPNSSAMLGHAVG